MKRLTSNAPLTEAEAMNLSVTNLYARLKEYEDTGLEPEEVAYCLGAAMSVKEDKAQYAERKKCYDEYMVWKKAESEDRLLILPCKVGDVLHRIYSMNHIEEDRVMGFLVSAYGVWYWGEAYRETPIEKIGKTVFLAREEAEAALKGGDANATRNSRISVDDNRPYGGEDGRC